VHVEADAAVSVRAFAGRIGLEDEDLLFRGDAVVAGGVSGDVPVEMRRITAPPVPFDWWEVEGEAKPGEPAAILLLTYVDAATGAPVEASRVFATDWRGVHLCDLDTDRRYVLPLPLGEQLVRFRAQGYETEGFSFATDEPAVISATIRLRRAESGR
jgi:hypothetical protein